jgi:ATP-dependent DNA helicase RecG
MSENQNIEFKESWRDEYLKWICGFANAQGGTIYIGKNDEGNDVGIKNSARLMEEIPNKVLHLLGLIVDVNLDQDSEKDIIYIKVDPYPYPINYKGSYFYRSGSTNQELKGAALDRFLLGKSGKKWDGVPVPKIRKTDLKKESLELFRKKALISTRVDEDILNDSDEVLLDNLNLFEGKLLKRAALLLFHDNPEKFFPGAYIKIGFFRTDDDLIFQDEIHGCLFDQIEKTWDFLSTKYSEGAITYDGLNRIEKNALPMSAVREALLNAIAHKDYSQTSPIQISVYSDHTIFWNEGKLPENWTTDSLKEKHPSKPFNPDIANTLFRSGYIESWGRGTIKMINECIKGKILPPEFNYDFSGFMVSFFSDARKYMIEKGFSQQLVDIMLYAINNKEVSNNTVKELCKVSKATSTRYLKQLEGEFLERIGDTGRGTYYVIKGLTKGL